MKVIFDVARVMYKQVRIRADQMCVMLTGWPNILCCLEKYIEVEFITFSKYFIVDGTVT